MKKLILNFIQSFIGKKEVAVAIPELVVEPVVVTPVVSKPAPSNRKPGPKKEVPGAVAKQKRVYNKPKKKA